jgi:integrase
MKTESTDRSAMPLREFLRDIYIPMRMANSKGRSIQQLEVAINRFGVFIGHEPTLADLTETNVTAWMADGLKPRPAGGRESPLSPSTINSRLRGLTTIWRYAVRRRYIAVGDQNNLEVIDRLRVPKRNPRAWAVEEMEAIVKSSRRAHGRFMGIPAKLWWPAFLLVLYDTGLRLQSAMGIRFDEIDFTNKLLCIPPERMKNNCEQFYRLHDQTIEAILATIPPRRTLVFPFPFTKNVAIYRRFRVILRRAGLPTTRLDMFHKIRRTTATHISRLLGEQVAIRQLGHSDASCIKRYVDPRFTNDHMASQHLPRLAWESPRLLSVEATAIEPPAGPLPPVSIRFSRADLRGEGVDVFQKMLDHGITGPLVAQSLDVLGMRIVDFAAEVGMSKKYIGQVLAGKMPLSARAHQAISRALGLTCGRSGEADRVGQPQSKAKGGGE